MEERQADKSRHCVGCVFYKRYYAKGAVSFYRSGVGYCSRLNKVKESGEGCGEWKRRIYVNSTASNQDSTLKVLTKMARNVAVITQLLCEDE